MIIPKENKLTTEQLEKVKEIAAEYKVEIQEIVGTHRTLYAMKGDERHEILINRIEGLPCIERVDSMLSPYKLMDRKSDLAHHKIKIGEKLFGSEPIVIAGQCTIDPQNPGYFMATAEGVKDAGANMLRGGVWKPRTSPYSYQGDTRAMEILLEAREKTGMPVCTEIMDDEQLEMALDAEVDCFQIGTRNALNYSLLKKIGEKVAGKETLILLKRSRHMGPIDEFILAGEYIVAGGNPNILLCPRGTLPAIDGYRNYPDESIVPLLKQKTWSPVIVDPSHSVGKSIYVPQAAMAAIAYGADGVIVETHIDPGKGIGDDPKQSITPEVLKELIKDIKALFSMKSKYSTYIGE